MSLMCFLNALLVAAALKGMNGETGGMERDGGGGEMHVKNFAKRSRKLKQQK
jgi:hypothetical protein